MLLSHICSQMQQARLHGGGGSMPSLQAIDTNQSFPPNAFPVVSKVVVVRWLLGDDCNYDVSRNYDVIQ